MSLRAMERNLVQPGFGAEAEISDYSSIRAQARATLMGG